MASSDTGIISITSAALPEKVFGVTPATLNNLRIGLYQAEFMRVPSGPSSTRLRRWRGRGGGSCPGQRRAQELPEAAVDDSDAPGERPSQAHLCHTVSSPVARQAVDRNGSDRPRRSASRGQITRFRPSP